MKKINEILNFIKIHIMSFFLGVMIIGYTIWNRFIHLRLPKNITDFNNIYYILIISFNMIVLIIVIIITLWLLIFINSGKTHSDRMSSYILKFSLISKIFDILIKFRDIRTQGPKTVYSLIYDLFNVSHILERPFYNLSQFIMHLPIKYTFILTFIPILFNTLPKLVPAIIFMIEIFFYEHLNYFYKSLLLLIIPLIYNILLWTLEDLADKNTYFATAHIDILQDNEEGFKATFKKEIPPIEGAVDIIARKHDKELLIWFVYVFETYRDIKWLVSSINKKKKKFKYYERLIISTLYLCGWTYILYHIYIL